MKAIYNLEHHLLKAAIKRCLGIGYTFVVTFGTICQQGNQISFRLLSGRFLVLFLLLSSILIHNFYTSILVSTLIESSFWTAIQTIQDLADSDIPVGFSNSPWSKSSLKVLGIKKKDF